MFQAMQNYQDISFKSIQQGDLEEVLEDKKKEVKKQEKDYKDFLNAIKESLAGHVKDVKVSARLTESPVCIVSGEGVSLEMEKVLNQMPNGESVKAERILEVNPSHELFKKLYETYQSDTETIGSIASLLYYQSLVAEGIPLENPKEYTDALTALLSKK
jgi:molecular chaperone HtpG